MLRKMLPSTACKLFCFIRFRKTGKKDKKHIM